MPTEERCKLRSMMTQTASFTGEEGRGGWWVREEKTKKKQSWYKKCSLLRVHKKDIIFHIKSWFSDFIKLGSKKYIFVKWPHQNTSFPKKYEKLETIFHDKWEKYKMAKVLKTDELFHISNHNLSKRKGSDFSK